MPRDNAVPDPGGSGVCDCSGAADAPCGRSTAIASGPQRPTPNHRVSCPVSLIAATLLAGCATTQPAAQTLPFFGEGYRVPGDPCRRLGEDAYTNQFLDHTADLVGCPESYPGLATFVAETGAREVARRDGFILYSVPRG